MVGHRFFYCLRAREDGGASGDNVVDEEDVHPFKTFGMRHFEYSGEGVAPFHGRFTGLGGVCAARFQIVEHGQTGYVGYPRGNEIRLVVAAPQTFGPVNRHGHHGVDVAEKSGGLQLLSVEPRKGFVEVGLIVIFGVADEAGVDVVL